MKILRIIGVFLILLPLIPTFQTYSLKKKINDESICASNEIIHSTIGSESNSTKSFQVDYTYAHGILIKNAKTTERITDADVIVTSDGEPFPLAYSQGEEIRYTTEPSTQIEITKEQNFEGEIQFLNMVCGCENMAPTLFFYGSLILTGLLTPIGLYLTLRKL